MVVHRHLGLGEGVCLCPRLLSVTPGGKSWSGSGVHHGAATHVREAKGGAPVTSVLRAEDGEECGVLADGEQLPVAEGPATWCEVACKHYDVSEEGLHGDLCVTPTPAWEDTGQRDDVVNHGHRLHVVMRLVVSSECSRPACTLWSGRTRCSRNTVCAVASARRQVQ